MQLCSKNKKKKVKNCCIHKNKQLSRFGLWALACSPLSLKERERTTYLSLHRLLALCEMWPPPENTLFFQDSHTWPKFPRFFETSINLFPFQILSSYCSYISPNLDAPLSFPPFLRKIPFPDVFQRPSYPSPHSFIVLARTPTNLPN